MNISGYYQPRRFAYWVDEYGSQDPNIKPYLFLGPRTIISRLSAATATSGRILPIVPPFVNSTYDIQFYGPKVSCSEANSTISTIVDKFVASEMSSSQLAAQRVSNAYFAFVPDLSAIRDGATIESNGGDIPQPVFSNRMQGPSNGSNEIWMTFKRYANGSNCDTMSAGIPPSLESHYLVCRLHNASYHVNLACTYSIILIQKYLPLKIVPVTWVWEDKENGGTCHTCLLEFPLFCVMPSVFSHYKT